MGYGSTSLASNNQTGRAAAVAVLLAGLLAGVLPAPGAGVPAAAGQEADGSGGYTAEGGSTERVSLTSDGQQSGTKGNHVDPSISADGQLVAFAGDETLVADDTNKSTDIYVRDVGSDTTERVSVASDGTQADGDSIQPSISADGRYVAFASHAANLADGDGNKAADVFVHDRDTGVTTLVSAASDGTPGNGDSTHPSISADGRYVAFASAASDLVDGDTNGAQDVFVRDLQDGVTVRVSVADDGAQADGSSGQPALSADGTQVAFLSAASTLVAGDTNGTDDVFVHDRTTQTTARVSVGSDGTQADGSSREVAIADDGTVVAFVSDATNLVDGDTNVARDVFAHDRNTGQTTRVSVASDGTQADGHSQYGLALSATGRHVAFTSFATNLVDGDTNGNGDIFARDRDRGQTARVSVADDGSQANNTSRQPAISDDGAAVAFRSNADNLVDGDTNKAQDIFLRHRVPSDTTPPTVTVTAPAFGDQVWGEVTLTADATDDIAVDRVEFTVGDTTVGTDTTPPYSVTWDSTTVADGDHLITATAYDTAGHAAEDSVGVTAINSADAAGKIEADYQHGRIGVDEYVTLALQAAFQDPAATDDYGSMEIEGASAWLHGVMSNWGSLTSETQQWVQDYLSTSDGSTTATTSDVTTSSSHTCGLHHSGPGGIHQDPYDCSMQASPSVTLYWRSWEYPETNGIPGPVAEYADGFAEAEAHYGALGYPSISAIPAYAEQRDRGLSVDGSVGEAEDHPNGYIRLPLDPSGEEVLAAHELFHQFQYQYVPTIDATLFSAPSWWWLEATATWASHQVADEQGWADTYSGHLDDFFGQTDKDLDDFQLLFGGGRPYGAFVVAEWLHANVDVDAIRHTWEKMELDNEPLPAIDAVLTDAGVAGGLEAALPDLWQDLYFLDISIPDRVDQATTNAWRTRLPFDGPPYSVPRMPAQTLTGLDLGDSEGVSASIQEGGAVVVELDGNDAGPLVFEGSLAGTNTTRTSVRAFALTSYDTDPTTGPDSCADATVTTSDSTFRVEVADFDPALCDGVSVLFTNHGWDGGSVTMVGQAGLGTQVDTTISNGTIRLGIHAEGHLNVPGYDSSSGTGTTTVGLRYLPTNADALAPGIECEGWGIADPVSEASGWANVYCGPGTARLDVIEANFGPNHGLSRVLADDTFEVWHQFMPIADVPNLYEIQVLIINATSVEKDNLRNVTPAYRRVMDWDVEPTAFSEYVTLQAVGHTPAELVYSSDNGFAHPDPLSGPTYLLEEGLFVDHGPHDIGALIDLQFDELAPGESVGFTMWYGAAASETEALAALDAVNPDLYSLAQPDVDGGAETGEPNTFIWAYASPTADLTTSTTEDDTTARTVDEYNDTLPAGTQQEPTTQ